MKTIIAIIRPGTLEAIEQILDHGVACLMSTTQMFGYGPEPTEFGVYRGVRYRVRRAMLRLEIALDDEFVAPVIRAIRRTDSAGQAEDCGECKVFVIDMDDARQFARHG
jgi:nitrogen regulatory protein PII